MLEDSSKTKELIKMLEDKGMANPSEKLGVNANKIKEAIRIIFPNLPRLDMVGKAKFALRNLDEMEE